MRKRINLGAIAVRGYVYGLAFFSKKHRSLHIVRRCACYGYPRCLDCQNFGYILSAKERRNFLANLVQQLLINKMIEKSADLEDVSGLNLAVPQDALLQNLHSALLYHNI